MSINISNRFTMRISMRRALRGLAKYEKLSDRNKLLRKALRKAGNYILKLTKQYVPKNSGLLKKSLAVKVRYYSKTKAMVVVIGPRSWYTGTVNGKKQITHKYAHIAERGRKAIMNRKLIKSASGKFFSVQLHGSFIAAAKGQSFVAKAAKIGARQAIAIVREVIDAGL